MFRMPFFLLAMAIRQANTLHVFEKQRCFLITVIFMTLVLGILGIWHYAFGTIPICWHENLLIALILIFLIQVILILC